MEKPLRNALVALPCLLLLMSLVVLFGVIHAYMQRRQAERFLAVLQQVQVGLTNEAAVLRLTEPLRSHREEYLSNAEKGLSFVFENRGLYLLRLAPYTSFRAYITFGKNGVVIQKSGLEQVAGYVAFDVPGVLCAASVRESLRGEIPLYGVDPGDLPNHIVYAAAPDDPNFARRSLIEDDITYGEAERHRDWTFNLACLTRIGGCRDARFLLPNAIPTTH